LKRDDLGLTILPPANFADFIDAANPIVAAAIAAAATTYSIQFPDLIFISLSTTARIINDDVNLDIAASNVTIPSTAAGDTIYGISGIFEDLGQEFPEI
jgi:hypothetical protein